MDLSFLPPDVDENAQEGLSFLPEDPTSLLPVVPRNSGEIAAQAAVAMPTQSELRQGALDYLGQINQWGVQPVLRPIWEKHMEEQINAARTSAQQAAIDGNVDMLDATVRHIQELEQKKQAGPNSVETHQAAVTEAIENASLDMVNKYPSILQFSNRVDEETRRVVARNVMLETLEQHEAKARDESGLLDKLLYFGSQVLPGASLVEGYFQNKKFEGSTGQSHPIDDEQAIREMVNYMAGLNKEQLESVLSGIEDQTGNKFRTAAIFAKLQEYSSGEARLDDVFKVVDVVGVLQGASALLKAGKPIHALKAVAGSETAAKALAEDVLKGTSITGLNDSEKVAAALAAGKNPFELDPTQLQGLDSGLQKELLTASRELGEELANRLQSSGLNGDEVKKALADLRLKYDPAANPSIHSVFFGEASDAGQHMTVVWQGPNGRSFATKEAAEQWAKREGLGHYEVVPVPTQEIKKDLHPFEFGEEELALLSQRLDDELGYAQDLVKGSKDSTDRALYNAYIAKIKSAKAMMKAKQWQELDEMVDELGLYDEAPDVAGVEASARATQEAREVPLGTNAFKEGRVTEYSKSIDPKTQGVVDELRNIFGLQDQKLFVTTAKDLDELEGVYPELIDLVKEQHVRGTFADSARTAGGVYTYNPRKGYHAIAINDSKLRGLSDTEKLETLVHEFGHFFFENAVRKDKALVNEIRKEFQKFSKMQDEDFDKFFAMFRQSSMATGKDGAYKTPSLSAEYVEWLKNAEEWFVEQFGKFAFTNAKPRNAIERFFADLVSRIKQAYAALSRHFGTDVSKPNASVERILKDHIRNVEAGQAVEAIMRALGESGGVKQSLAPSGAPKPRIKLKAATAVPADPAGGWVVREKRFDPLSYANVGKYSDDDIGSMPTVAIDPKHGASELAVEERVIGVHQEAKIKEDLKRYIKPFYDKLNKNEKARVASVLEEGNSYGDVAGQVGHEFNLVELRGKGLNDKEIAAYFATRSLRMFTWQSRNAEMVRHLGAMGMKEFGFSVSGPVGKLERVFGKKAEVPRNALNKLVHDARTGQTIRVTEELLEEVEKGLTHIAELYQPHKIGDKYNRYVVFNDKTGSFRDITTAIPYRPGEYSRIYTDEYFITAKRGVDVDGVADEWDDTVRTALSEREAKKYISSMNTALKLMRATREGSLKMRDPEKALTNLIGEHTDVREFVSAFNAGEFDDVKAFDWHYNRTDEDYLNSSLSEAFGSGRPFYNKRGERIYSVDKTRANTKNVMESIEAEITNIGRVMSISQWRETSIRRWMNTFGHLIPNRTDNEVADFFAMEGQKFAKNSQDSLFAERTHAYIMRQLGMKTKEEQMYAQLTRSLSEKYMQGHVPIETLGAKVRKMGALGFLRNVNFNLTLGMWNPAQLIVQANGAATAIALHPLHGLSAAKTFPLLRMALMSDNPEVWAKLAKAEKLTSLGLKNTDDFINTVKAIRKTGILANLRSTSLYNLEDGKLNIFGGYGRKAWETQDFFFNRGEEFSRVVSFDVARREWIGNNPGKDWTSNLALKQIVVRMDDLTQNMTKANLAFFQQGALSIPFQFLQYNLKLGANVISAFATGGKGRGFTRIEAAKLMAGHLALYGAAGNGALWLVDEIMGDDTKNSLSVEQKTYIAQGLLSGLMHSMSKHFSDGEPMNVALGTRLGSFNWYQQVAEAAWKGDASFYDVVLGPTAAYKDRFGKVAEIVGLWKQDPDLTADDIIDGFGKMTVEQASSLRNLTKAYLYAQHEGKMVNRRGEDVGSVNGKEILAQALGFPPTVAQDVYNMQKAKASHDDTLKDLAKQIGTVQKDILANLQKNTPEGKKRAEEQMKLLKVLWPTNAGDLQQVQYLLKDNIYPYDSQFNKLVGQHLYESYNYEQPLTVTKEPNGAQKQ
jgi:hypothetical protein